MAVDNALSLAIDAGKQTTGPASSAFAEAQKKLLWYEKSAHPR